MPPGGGSERYTRGRLSPNPLSMGMHSTLARDELLPPTREELRLLSGGHFDPPSLGGVRSSFLSSLSAGDREPSLLDQVMAERQRGGWRLDDDPLLMSRRHDEISRQDDMARQQNEISRQQDEMTRRHNESSRRFDEETSESGGRRVFLRNLPWSTTSRHLKNFFNRMIGPVTYAEVMMMPSGRSKGTGVVEFASSSLAKKAITEFNGQTLGGRVIEISEDKFERK